MWSALRAMCDVMWNFSLLPEVFFVGPGLTSLGSR